MNTPANQIEQRARDLFVQSCDQLDADTRMRLREARNNALAGKQPRRVSHMWLPAGAMAASVLALGITWHDNSVPQTHQPAVQTTSASTQSAPDNADVDMYNDLDFYRWLAQQPAVAQRSGN